MPAERHPADFIETDLSAIELRVLAFYTQHGVQRHEILDAKEQRINALMTPTGRYRRA